MPWGLLNSKAYCALTHSARACLPYWLGKPKARFDSSEYYEKEFVFPYPEAKRYGFAKATFAKIIRELVEKGFVDPKDKGGLRGAGLSYNHFVLSRRWQKFNTHDFENVSWSQFQPRLKQRQVQIRNSVSSKMEPVAIGATFQ
jgi:hypothetical protein